MGSFDDDDAPDIPELDLYELGGRALSVCGPFGSTTIVAIPTDVAQRWFPDGIPASGRTEPVTAVTLDLDTIRKSMPELAESGIAATAVQMAYELVNPYNSATSKSMCAGRLLDALKELRSLAPPEEKRGTLHAIRGGRAARLAEGDTGT